MFAGDGKKVLELVIQEVAAGSERQQLLRNGSRRLAVVPGLPGSWAECRQPARWKLGRFRDGGFAAVVPVFVQ